MTDREISTDLGMVERLVAPAHKDVVDIGCGGGALVRDLAARGARATGIEISEAQLAAARARDAGGAGRYLVGRAEDLPLTDASVDIALFMRALHHVPAADLMAALGEGRRVLRPGGVVYIAEPLAEGDYFALTSLVEDEREVRQAAQAAVARAAEAGLQPAIRVEYDVLVSIGGPDAYRERLVSVDAERGAVFDARRAEIEQALARLGEPGERPGERVFRQPMRVDLLRRPGGG